MLPLYQTFLETQLTKSELLIFDILIHLLQIHKWVRSESLANRFPLPITFESRRRKLQRFLCLDIFDLKKLWFPILTEILKIYFPVSKPVNLVADRTRWQNINIFVVSLIYQKRGIPIYFELLNKKGNSSSSEQIEIFSKVFPLFKDYQKVVLGDREFCSVELAKWLKQQPKTKFVLRIKKNEYFHNGGEWIALKDLGLTPGMSLFFEGVSVTKTKGFGYINIIAKWKRNYGKNNSKEPWFLLTNFSDLGQSIKAYQQRMGIEEMFRDFKKGGYNLEGTKLDGKRLLSLIMLITFAYTEATLLGDKIGGSIPILH
jgi:hypothetical protein